MAELIGSRWLVSTSCHFIYTGRYRGTAAASAALLATARRNNATWPNEVCAHSSLSIHRGLVDKRENRIALAETLFINKSRDHVTGKCLSSLALNRAVFQGSPLLSLFFFVIFRQASLIASRRGKENTHHKSLHMRDANRRSVTLGRRGNRVWFFFNCT
jgi:hypothetical protein